MAFSLDQLRSPDQLAELAVPMLVKLVVALLIFFGGRLLVRLLLKLTTRGLRRAQADETLVMFLSKVLYVAGLVLVVVAALDQLGIAATSAAAVLGAGALAVGLALQNQLASFAAGVLLIVFRPFRVGEWIDAAGKSGNVTEVNIFSTVLTNFENQQLTIPNAKIWGDAIVNHSRNPWQRLDLTISVSYNADLAAAKRVLDELLASDTRIRAEPAASVAVRALGASSVDFAVRACASNDDTWPLQCDLLERIKLRFDAEGIDSPLPQMNLHVRSLPQMAAPEAKSPITKLGTT